MGDDFISTYKRLLWNALRQNQYSDVSIFQEAIGSDVLSCVQIYKIGVIFLYMEMIIKIIGDLNLSIALLV